MINREDIIRMARDANLPSCHLTHPKALERFAALVAAHEREQCAKDGDTAVRFITQTLPQKET
jgi:hypothetical protein